MMKILITGGTGFLGQYLVKELATTAQKIFVLARNKTNIFKDYKNVEFIRADLTDPQLDFALEGRVFDVDIIIHMAALYDIQASYDKAFLQNVFATQNMLGLSKKIPKLKAFYYVSTIAVGDEQSFYLEEDSLPKRTHFSNFYSQTKYLAEKMVRDSSSLVPIRIIRPGIIIGDSETGQMPKGDGPYYFMDVLKKHSLMIKALPYLPLPFHPLAKLPLIPVNHCANLFSLLIKRDDYTKEIKTYHLISAEVPTVREFLEDLNLELDLKVEYLPVPRNPVHNTILKLLGIPTELVAFMFSRTSYDKTRTNKELPELEESRYGSYKKKIFSYLD